MAIRRGYALLFLIFVTLGIYYPSIFAEISPVDDVQIITSYINTDRFDLKTLFIPNGGYYYRPLLGLTLIFDKFAWEMHESFIHLENILIHAINVILVYLITEIIARRYEIKSAFLPLIASFLFAVHPINTESVNWIAGRTDLLAGFFLLISILLILKSLESSSQSCGIAGVMLFFMACMSKEVAVSALPGLLAIIFFYDQQGSYRERLRKNWASSGALLFTVLFFSLLMLRFFIFNRGDNGIKLLTSTHSNSVSDLLSHSRLVFTALGFYVKKLFIPWPLNFAIVKVSGYYIWVGVAALVYVFFLFVKRGLLSALVITTIALISPALLVSVARMTWTPLAERYLYMPNALFCIIITVIAYKKLSFDKAFASKLLLISLILLFIFISHSTVKRNILWQDNVALMRDTLRNSPDFYLAQNALAFSLKQKNRYDESRALMMSIKAPDGSKRGGKLIDSNQAMILVAQGDFYGAKKLLLRNSENAGVLHSRILENLVSVNLHLLAREKNEEKVLTLKKETVGFLLELHEKSGDPFYYYRIGQFYLNTGDKLKASHYFSEAAQRSPQGTHYKLAAEKLSNKLKE